MVMFDFFPIIFVLMFALVLGVFIMSFVRGISEWNSNNKSPRLSVPAKVVAKRDHVRHTNRNGHVSRSSTYYVTFEFESTDRLELNVPSSEFGMLVEGDTGTLSFQGTRYLSFERKI